VASVSRRKIAGWLAVLLLIMVAAAVVTFSSGPVARQRAETRRLVYDAFSGTSQGRDAALAALQKMGATAYPFIGEMLLARDNSLTELFYGKIRPKLPQFILRRLGDQRPPGFVEYQAVHAIRILGPSAARGMNCELCRALPTAGSGSYVEILNCLLWSAPESAQTTQTISNYLASANPGPFPDLDGRMRGLAAKMPQWAPLVANHSGFRHLLSAMGTNARPQIPVLRNVALGNSNAAPPSARDWDARVEAIETLGRIGKGDPQVIATLLVLANEARREIRLAALLALARMEACPKGALLAGLKRTAFSTEYEIARTIYMVGEVGSGAGEALPWIDQFSSTEKLEASQDQAKSILLGAGRTLPEWLVIKSVIAASRVDSAQARRYAPELVLGLRVGETIALVFELKPCEPAFLDKLSTVLANQSDNPGYIAAVIVAHNPRDAKALQTLRLLAGHGLDEAFWLWKFAGDAGPFLSLARSGLAATDPTTRIETSRRLAEIGAAARSLGPALQALLNSTDTESRWEAGFALQKVAPELMAPIHECK
jgi:hypothetical protein